MKNLKKKKSIIEIKSKNLNLKIKVQKIKTVEGGTMELIIDNRQDKLEINEELIEKIKDIISECLDYEGYDDDYEVSLSFVDNKEIHQLNRDFNSCFLFLLYSSFFSNFSSRPFFSFSRR